jgi:CubicO group peptidase (beta-lactamase class C family)
MENARLYHDRHKGQALLVQRGEAVLLESYADGFSRQSAHALYSGTKSFWGLAAVEARSEGLLSLDERVAETFGAWNDGALKASVTLRQLVQLTAGVPFGGLGSAVPPYEKALATELRAQPGTTFTYGGIPLQIFGAVFAKKLDVLQLTPHQYLHARILDPNGIAVSSWRTLKDGTHPLPTGAFLTAENWLRFGRYVCANAARYGECFVGSAANPRYGLGWWLAPPKLPPDLVYASGSGGQALYVVPSLDLVAVRFGNGGSFNHEAFLKRLLAG